MAKNKHKPTHEEENFEGQDMSQEEIDAQVDAQAKAEASKGEIINPKGTISKAKDVWITKTYMKIEGKRFAKGSVIPEELMGKVAKSDMMKKPTA